MELFDTLLEAKVLIERWKLHYNTVRLHSSITQFGCTALWATDHLRQKQS